MINAAKKGEIDIVFAAQKTPSRLKYLDFTDTILIQHNKILSNISKPYKLLDLENKKVAITKGSAIEEYIKHNYPYIKIIATKNELEALKLLNNAKVDAAIAETVRASYYINKYNLNNITITDDLGYNYYLSIATISSKPILNTIISKAVASIPQEKLKALKLKWGYIQESSIDIKTLIFIITIMIITIIFSIYLFIINKKLKKEIIKKESALRRIEKLKNEKIKQSTQIINMIAHQWKQPLNNLSVLNQLLINAYYNNKLDDNLLNYFKKESSNQINFMSNTIKDFLNFFKIEEELQKFDVKEVIKEVIELNQDTFKKKHIRVEIKLPKSPLFIRGYPNALKEALLNILTNSIEALENQDFKLILIKAYKKDKIFIEIEDNAGGIDENIIDKIFDPYFSTKNQKNGTGLGLYIVKLMVEERLKGKIKVENSEYGAKFLITIPIN